MLGVRKHAADRAVSVEAGWRAGTDDGIDLAGDQHRVEVIVRPGADAHAVRKIEKRGIAASSLVDPSLHP